MQQPLLPLPSLNSGPDSRLLPAAQLGLYERGQLYAPHFDAVEPHAPAGRLFLQNGGQRVVTLLTYLNTPAAGGCTAFPMLGLRFAPRARGALLFCPATADGRLDGRALHTAEPAIDPKWVSQVWVRQSGDRRDAEVRCCALCARPLRALCAACFFRARFWPHLVHICVVCVCPSPQPSRRVVGAVVAPRAHAAPAEDSEEGGSGDEGSGAGGGGGGGGGGAPADGAATKAAAPLAPAPAAAAAAAAKASPASPGGVAALLPAALRDALSLPPRAPPAATASASASATAAAGGKQAARAARAARALCGGGSSSSEDDAAAALL
jgi:hypothetical protein